MRVLVVSYKARIVSSYVFGGAITKMIAAAEITDVVI